MSQAQHRQIAGTNHSLAVFTVVAFVFALVILDLDLRVVEVDYKRRSVVDWVAMAIQQRQS